MNDVKTYVPATQPGRSQCPSLVPVEVRDRETRPRTRTGYCTVRTDRYCGTAPTVCVDAAHGKQAQGQAVKTE